MFRSHRWIGGFRFRRVKRHGILRLLGKMMVRGERTSKSIHGYDYGIALAMPRGTTFCASGPGSAIFGFVAAVVASYRGLNPGHGPKGVGDAVNQSVVITFVLTFLINLVVTTVYLQLFPAKGV